MKNMGGGREDEKERAAAEGRERREERGGRNRQRTGQQAHRSAPCADCGSATAPPTGGSFPLSHSASPPRITRASVVGGNEHSYTVLLLPRKVRPALNSGAPLPKGTIPSLPFTDVQQHPRASLTSTATQAPRDQSASVASTPSCRLWPRDLLSSVAPPLSIDYTQQETLPTWRRASSACPLSPRAGTVH